MSFEIPVWFEIGALVEFGQARAAVGQPLRQLRGRDAEFARRAGDGADAAVDVVKTLRVEFEAVKIAP